MTEIKRWATLPRQHVHKKHKQIRWLRYLLHQLDVIVEKLSIKTKMLEWLLLY